MANLRGLQQAQFAQLARHGGRKLLAARGFRLVAGRVLGIEIAPALEGAARLARGRRDLRLELHQHRWAAAAIDDRHEAADALTRLDIALDHPIDRAAIEDLLLAAR